MTGNKETDHSPNGKESERWWERGERKGEEGMKWN